MVHNVPDKCTRRTERQRAKPGMFNVDLCITLRKIYPKKIQKMSTQKIRDLLKLKNKLLFYAASINTLMIAECTV